MVKGNELQTHGRLSQKKNNEVEQLYFSWFNSTELQQVVQNLP